MRPRKEIEEDIKSWIQDDNVTLNRIVYFMIEVLLDIREQNDEMIREIKRDIGSP